jgi:hypothetical protein
MMFGGFIESAAKDEHFVAEATNAAFQVLVDALVERQKPATSVAMIRCRWRASSGPSSMAQPC